MSPSLHRQEAELVGPLSQRHSRCIHNIIEDQVRSQPRNSAIVAHDGHYNYKDLWEAVSKLATRLIRHGAYPEARAVVLMDKSVNYTLAILAVIKSGAAFVPLDPAHPVQRLKQLMQDTKPFILITTSSLTPLARRIFTDVLVIDANANQYEEIQPHHVTIHTASPENAAYIMFTSGSTGKPKGVIVEHAAFTTSAMARGKITGLGPHSRVLQFAAHTFDVAVDEILTTLIHGGCVCVPSEAERFDISSTITRMQVNHALITPTSAALLDPDLVPSLKTIQMGGELLSEHINDKWSNRVRLFNVYGPTEASVASVMNDRTGQRGAGHVIGLPVGTVCFVVDVDDHDVLVPSNMIGELIIGGHTLARGYLDDTAKTNQAFIHSPEWASWSRAEYPLRFYKTGDLASMDSNGFLTIHGRKDNQIKLRGQRINVEEIEVALQTHEHIHGVIVDLPKGGPLKNKLTAVVPEGPKNKPRIEIDDTRGWSSGAEMLDEDLVTELHTSLRNTVPLTMIPSVWISLPYMPQNSSAKTDRKQIRAWLEGLDTATYQSLVRKREVHLSMKDLESKKVPVSEQKDAGLEAKLKSIWCEVLNTSIDGIQENQSFVRNGGDSITAMELRSLASAIGVSVKVSDILTAESVKDLLQRSSRVVVQVNAYCEEETREPFPIFPTQKFYLDLTAQGTEHFTQQACLEIRSSCGEETICSAIATLVSRHSMLRARFLITDEHQLQYIAENNGQSFNMSRLVVPAEQDLESVISNHVPYLSPFEGPVFHALLIERPAQNPVLLLVAHHLVIDFVSWRILLQELEDIIKGNKLLPVTMPYRSWCSMQPEFTAILDAAHILNHPVTPSDSAFWAPEHGSLQNVYGKVQDISFSIPAAESKALLLDTANVHGTTTAEIMIASLFGAFADVFTDRETPTIFVESHGREPWDPTIDISRTVGWFTTAYPLSVPRKYAQDLSSAISQTKSQRRVFADNGHAYWCCRHLTATGQSMFATQEAMEFVFNFAGQYQRLDRDESIIRRLSPVGEERAHPSAPRLSIFDILVSAENGELDFHITFPKDIRHRARVRHFAETWRRSMVAIAKESLRVSSHLEHDLSHDLSCEHAEVLKNTEEVYRVSKLQQHILLSQANNPMYYQVVGRWKLRSRKAGASIDQARLRMSWEKLVRRHANLRTVFASSSSSDDFLGIVLRDTHHALASDRTLHLPHKFDLSQSEDGSILMRLEFSHAIIDAASRDILLQELLSTYSFDTISSSSTLYTHYLNHLASKPSASNTLPLYPRCIFPTTLLSTPEAIKYITVPRLPLSPNPISLCRTHNLTFPSLIFTLWSLILSRHTGSRSTSFAHTLSDRPGSVPHVRSAVGCYIKLLVCSVEWEDEVKVWDMARRVQGRYADGLSGDEVLVDASEYESNGTAEGWLNTMVNVRSTAVSAAVLESDAMSVEMLGSEDPWNYDISLSVDGSSAEDLDMTICYRSTSVSQESAESLAIEVSKTLLELLNDTDATRKRLEHMMNGF